MPVDVDFIKLVTDVLIRFGSVRVACFEVCGLDC